MIPQSYSELHVTSSYESISTLDEPVWTTIQRDLKAIGQKLMIVVWPFSGNDDQVLRDWDLWGPLILCLLLALMESIGNKKDQGSLVFSAVFVMVWMGAAVVTLNAKLLGSSVAFFQTVCVMGYCLAPICLGALWCLFISYIWLNFFVVFGFWMWACWAVVRFYKGTVVEEKEMLVMYPVALFYALLSWIVLSSV